MPLSDLFRLVLLKNNQFESDFEKMKSTSNDFFDSLRNNLRVLSNRPDIQGSPSVGDLKIFHFHHFLQNLKSF